MKIIEINFLSSRSSQDDERNEVEGEWFCAPKGYKYWYHQARDRESAFIEETN